MQPRGQDRIDRFRSEMSPWTDSGRIRPSYRRNTILSGGVGVHLPLAAGRESDVDETASVLLPLVGTALGPLGLLLGLNLGGL